MGLLDKVKNLFTEEVEEEEITPIKNEVRHIEVEAPTRVERENSFDLEEKEESKKDEKFVFFSDDDFKDLEKPVVKEKPTPIKKEVPMYRSAPTVEEDKKMFKPSPIISPVYGVLDKNYSKEEVVSKKVTIERPTNSNMSVDDVRRKAYGTIEDDFNETLSGKNIEPQEAPEVGNIDIFEELEKYDKLDELEARTQQNNETIDVDDLFDSLDNKKEEIIEELDNKKEEILDELDNKKEDIIVNDNEDLDDLDLDEETLELSKQLETQKKRLDEINDIIPDEIEEEKQPENDDLNESELFDLIDSMYDKKDDE